MPGGRNEYRRLPPSNPSPLGRVMRGSKPRTADSYEGKNAMTAHQDATPHDVPEPSMEERLRGSAPWCDEE